MTQPPDLLPCPFCGGPATREHRTTVEIDGKLYPGETFLTGCDNQGCLVLPRATQLSQDYADEYWNTRIPNKSAEVDLSALKAEIIAEFKGSFHEMNRAYPDGYAAAMCREMCKLTVTYLSQNGHLATGKGGDVPPLCHSVDFGSYDNTVLVQTPQGKLATIDICMIPEIKWLWDHGIETIECCCGHEIQPGYIAVTEASREKMDSLGYKPDPKAPHCYLCKSVKTAEPCGDDGWTPVINAEKARMIAEHPHLKDAIENMTRNDHDEILKFADFIRNGTYPKEPQLPLPAAPTQIDAGELKAAIDRLELSNTRQPIHDAAPYIYINDVADVIKAARAHLSKLSGGGK